MAPERLSGLDASFLYMETPTLHMHVAMAAVFDPPTVPGGYSFRRVRQLISDRIPLAPVFQRRLVEVPLRLGFPVWVDDPEFDIDNHLRRAALPAPGGLRELGDFAADVISRQLHRDRPLWELWIVEGVEDGKIALVTKMHHSTIDGVSGAELLGVLFDLEPDPPEQSPSTARLLDSRIPSSFELMSQAMMANLVAPFDLGRMMLRTTRNIFGISRIRRGLPDAAKGALPLTAPRTSINAAVHARRRVAFAAASLADAKTLKNEVGTTVNDVVLAMVAGALRSWLSARGETLSADLRVLVPVSFRTAHGRNTFGNQISAVFCPLPVGEPNPTERLRKVREAMKGLKESGQAVGAQALTRLGDFAPPTILAQAARLQAVTRFFNLVVTNVPGPQFPLYLLGRRLVSCYPQVPLAAQQTVGIALLSYAGNVGVGLLADLEVRDLGALAGALQGALDELSAVAEAHAREQGPLSDAPAPREVDSTPPPAPEMPIPQQDPARTPGI